MSYMDRKKILSEGFFGMLKKFLSRSKLSPTEKKLMKDPEFKKAFNAYEKAANDALETGNALLRKKGIEPIKY
jgi:hypothetical protein